MSVRMTHPDLPNQPIDVPESAVPMHRASGWRTDDETGSQSPDDETGSQPPPADPPASKQPTTRTATTGSSKE